jgi:hypothetical protein
MKKVETVKTAEAAAPGLARLLLLFLTFSVLSLLPTGLSAEVPMKFNYQGNLRQAGFLVNGTRNMVFRIFDSSDPANSTELCPALAHSVDVSTGVFRVTLEPVIADWQTGSLWLELTIEGHTLSPREELTSSPYAVNSMMISGKKYTSGTAAAVPEGEGDLWMDTDSKKLKFWNGNEWVLTSGSGVPAFHAPTHGAGATDPIVSLGTHTVTGSITFNTAAELRVAAGVPAVIIATNAVVRGTLNPASNLLVGGAGYSVSFSSSVSAGWFYGNGSGLTNLNASNITTGQINGGKIAAGTIVSTHIADGSITRLKLNNSGCSNGQLLKWDAGTSQWICSEDSLVPGGAEVDPLSIHIQDSLQSGATFYVSSGTVNNLTVNNQLGVFGPARLRGSPAAEGLAVTADGDVGVGTAVPNARMEVTGSEAPGKYIMIFNSGTKLAAWLRNK